MLACVSPLLVGLCASQGGRLHARFEHPSVLRERHQPIAQKRVARRAQPTANLQQQRHDWSFLDKAYLITCPDQDGANPRLDKCMPLLESVGLADCVQVRSFAKDDADRIRGCYSSHIAVMEEAQALLQDRKDVNVLILEDNLALSPRFKPETLNAVRRFVTGDGATATFAGELRRRCCSRAAISASPPTAWPQTR